MPCCVIDSDLFADMFGSAEMRRIFSDENKVACWLRVEAALAKVQSEMGIIPKAAGEEIARVALSRKFDLTRIKEGMELTGHPLVPLIRLLRSSCDGELGEYVHYGATTQDIVDTGFMLQVREALDALISRTVNVQEQMIRLARHHSETLMAGRTHGQHALPITFGFKVAIWISEFSRHIGRLVRCRRDNVVGNLTGAVGTFAGLGDKGEVIQNKVMQELGLATPDICWHSSRDRAADIASSVSMVAATCGKIANEIYNLQKTEAGELEEPFPEGRVGSSTMPHKRNPSTCEVIVSLSKAAKSAFVLALDSMWQEHERDAALWRLEWIAMPPLFVMAGGALEKLRWVLAGLKVNKDRMRSNLDLLGGLVMSESVMLALGNKVGKQTAHEIVYDVAMKAFEMHIPFRDALLRDARVSSNLAEGEFDRLLDPSKYLGLARDVTLRVADTAERQIGEVRRSLAYE